MDDICQCSLRQAVEYLAFGWYPKTEDKEILEGTNREQYFSESSQEKLFSIRQSALRLKQYLINGQLSFYAVIDEDKTDIAKLEKGLKDGNITQEEYTDALKVELPSSIMFVMHCIERDFSKSLIEKQPYWDDFFEVYICHDIDYYKNPYHYQKDSEYDLFYIKTHNGHDIRYLDIYFNFENLKNIAKHEIDESPTNEDYDKKVLQIANKLKNEKGMTNNKAAKIIRKQLDVQDSRYPSLSQIRNLIEEIIPTRKRQP